MVRTLPALLALVAVFGAQASAQSTKLVPDDAQAFDHIGSAVSLSGPRLAVGSRFSDGADFNTGAVYLWIRQAGTWVLETKLTAPAPAINDQFGYALALDGDALLVGTQTSEGGPFELKGSAQVFRSVAGRWVQEGLLSPEPLSALSRFGWSVDLDGDLALVGAPTHEVDFGFSGAAWVFRRDGERWIEETLLVPQDSHEEQLFGHDVSLSGDLAAVSGVWDSWVEFQAGAVYLFQRDDDGTWSELVKLQPDDLEGNDEFGAALALDGRRLAVGSPSDDDHGNTSGSVYVYARTALGWALEQKLTAEDAAQDEHFGQDVALSGDTLVVGAIHPEGRVPWGGSAYVFRFDGQAWRQQSKLKPDALLPAGYFGTTVTVDRGRVAGGAHLDSQAGEQSGAAYVFDQVAPPLGGTEADVR
jgi:hypothetical protein